MKFLLLMYAPEGAWAPEEHAQALSESVSICHQLHEHGKYIHASPLDHASPKACVRVRQGQTFVSDGPFIETKEQLGGYFIIDVANLDEAIQVAARIPGAWRGTAEIRPILEVDNLPKTRS